MVSDSLLTDESANKGSERENRSAPPSYSEIFLAKFPYYLSIGMTEEQYWDRDSTLVKSYRKAEELRKERVNQEMWLQGMYIYDAISRLSPILRAFAKKGTKAQPYATSHKYVDNLMRVIETWHLTDYDKKEETKMSNSPLVVYTKLSPNHSGQRTHSIDRITPHCVVGQLSAESICGCFISTSRQASCNYGIGTDGRISMSVEEKNRSWCSSSRENDQRAVTIECASDKTAPYAFNNAVYASLVNLCVDICQRNGKSKLLWLGDKNKTLAYAPKSDEMVLTVHRWFANKSCPGDWLYNRLGNLAAEVTKRLTGGSTDTGKVDVPSDGKTLYRVQTGAFSKRSNADAWAAKLKAAGFDTYIVQMGNLYKVQVGAYSQKSNAENMMVKLKAAGYDAFITTKSGTAAGTAKKSAAEIAKEIYNGTCSDARWSSWGNGADRVNRLKQAGYDPSEVQSEVNKLF